MDSNIEIRSLERILMRPDGVELNHNVNDASLSADGTRLAFTSFATNVLPGENGNGKLHVYVKDLVSGEIFLVTESMSGGFTPDDGGDSPAISPDGTSVIFGSRSSELVSFDQVAAPGQDEIFLRNLETGETELISVDADGNRLNGISYSPVYSPDGKMVAFKSSATNLVPNDTNGSSDYFLKDLETGEVTLITTNAAGEQANGLSSDLQFSPDGTKVLFLSRASNLTRDNTFGDQNLFVKDLVTGAVTMVSTDSRGLSHPVFSLYRPAFAPDGESVIFTANILDLIPRDLNGVGDIFSKNLATREVLRLSVSEDGAELNDVSEGGVLSPDGRLLAFASRASNLVEGQDNGWEKVYVKDLLTGAVTLVSVAPDGTEADHRSQLPVFLPDGQHILFRSDASVLVEGDTNEAADFFIASLGPASAEIAVGRTEAEDLTVDAGFHIQTNPHASAHAFLQASGGGEQSAHGVFSGDTGLYTITVGYFDETDGASTLAVEVNGQVIDQWLWDDDPAGAIVTGAAAMRHVIARVALETGDTLSIVGSADGGEPLRTDFLDISAAPPGTGGFRVEAETLQIVKGFKVVQNGVASADAYLQADGGSEHVARHAFDGAAGDYDLRIGYFDETDGVSHMSVRVNGLEVDDWLWASTSGDQIVTRNSAAEHLIAGLTLDTGDVIELVGESDGGEPLRTDYLVFDPVDDFAFL